MPYKETITEKNVPDQSGKVFIVTGASSGVGYELSKILYAQNGRVYAAARDETKMSGMIKDIKIAHPGSKGELHFLHLDLNDLTTIKASAESFLSKESSLHVLWNNAGVMIPPQGSKTAQGYELQIGTNCVAPFLFTKLLTSCLARTAKTAPAGSVRVVWVSSGAAKGLSPIGGVIMDNLDYHNDKTSWSKYGTSKAGNILHASEYALKHGAEGVVSVSVDPGNLKTPLYRHLPRVISFFVNFALYEPIYGAYSELYAGLSSDINLENNGAFVEPWGKIVSPREDIANGTKSKAAGGTGRAEEFWQWSEQQVEKYL